MVKVALKLELDTMDVLSETQGVVMSEPRQQVLEEYYGKKKDGTTTGTRKTMGRGLDILIGDTRWDDNGMRQEDGE
jgi:hypothetical protein